MKEILLLHNLTNGLNTAADLEFRRGYSGKGVFGGQGAMPPGPMTTNNGYCVDDNIA